MARSTLLNPTRLEELMLYRLTGVVRTCSTVFVRLFEGELGFTRREWHVLAIVVQEGHAMPSEIAAATWLDRPRVSRALNALEARGLLTRTPDAGHQRSVRVQATPAGQALYERALTRAAELNRRIVSALSETEQAQLDHLLRRLQEEAEQVRHAEPIAARAHRHAGGTRHGPP